MARKHTVFKKLVPITGRFFAVRKAATGSTTMGKGFFKTLKLGARMKRK